MMRKLWIICFSLLLLNFSTVSFAQSTVCPDALPTQLIVGGMAQVTPGSANNVRREPSISAEQQGQISEGTIVYVREGPVCADGYAWWFVVAQDGSAAGWTVESVEDSYALIPYTVTTHSVEAPADGEVITHDGVRITIAPSLDAGEVLPETLVGTLPDEVLPGEEWLNRAEGIRFSFNSPTSTLPNDNRIEIYPAPAYMRVNPILAEDMFALQDLLAARPAPSGDALAGINFVNFAAQVLTVKGQYIETEQLIGVRYVAVFAQNSVPVLRDSLHYVFYGLSRDGQYFVDVRFRLWVDTLPTLLTEVAPEIWTPENGFSDADFYYSLLIDNLEILPPQYFEPRLETLDSLVASINIPPGTFAAYTQMIEARGDTRVAVPDLSSGACANADFPARLTVDGAARAVLSETMNYLPAQLVPGGGQTGWGGLPFEGVDVLRVMDGPVCFEGVNYWLLYTGRFAGWFPETASPTASEPMTYVLEPVTPAPDDLAVPPVMQGQAVSDCRLLVTGVYGALDAPSTHGSYLGTLVGGGTYYADALFRRPEGGYLYWRLTAGAVNQDGELLPEATWVNSEQVTPSPECADLPVIESP